MKHAAYLVTLTLLAGCGAGTIPTPKLTDTPAARYCVQMGGQIHVQREVGRGEVGYCHMPNGTVTEEWALFRARRG